MISYIMGEMIELPGYIIEPVSTVEINRLLKGKKIVDGSSVLFSIRDCSNIHELQAPCYKEEIQKVFNGRKKYFFNLEGIEHHREKMVLVLNNPEENNYIPLLQYCSNDLFRFLGSAIQLASMLVENHLEDKIHLSITTKCIHADETSGILRLCPVTVDPSGKEAGFKYNAPEMSGRMVRKADHRADLYTIGVIFYELLTGKLPFDFDDPIMLMHAHAAVEPAPVAVNNPGIPRQISDMVMKLLSKDPEHRYQSAVGLYDDLELCLKQLNDKGSVDLFYTGASDFSIVPDLESINFSRDFSFQQLKDSLLQFYETGTPVWITIPGDAGSGKSTLVQELFSELPDAQLQAVSGKFELQKMEFPYHGFIAAIRTLFRSVLFLYGTDLVLWKYKIISVTTTDTPMLNGLIPEMERITGFVPHIPEVTPSDSSVRLAEKFYGILKLFSDHYGRVLLFLDDFHWADSASVRLLNHLVHTPDIRNLMIVTTYRDKENGSELFSAALTDTDLNFRRITVNIKPVQLGEIRSFISHITSRKDHECDDMAHFLYTNSQGNPLYIKEILKNLFARKFFNYNTSARRWEYEASTIPAITVREDILDLITARFEKLPESTRNLIAAASVLGRKFETDELSEICRVSKEAAVKYLTPAVKEGIVIRNVPRQQENLHEDAGFSFLHDKVHQAVLSSISENEKCNTHLKIARLLQHRLNLDPVARSIYRVASHYNECIALVSDTAERELISRINFDAGSMAKKAAAYDAACRYFENSVNTLPHGSWENEFAGTYHLYLEWADSCYYNGSFPKAEMLLDLLLAKATTPIEKAQLYIKKLVLDHNRGNFIEAVHQGKTGLRLLGFTLTVHPSVFLVGFQLLKTLYLLRKRTNDELAEAPECRRSDQAAIMTILCELFSPAYFVSQNLMGLSVLKMLQLTLRFGNTRVSPLAFVFHGLLLSYRIGKYKKGFELGLTALKIAERLPDEKLKCKIFLVHGSSLVPWIKPLRDTLFYLEEAGRSGLRTGDPMHAGYALSILTQYIFLMGEPLEKVLARTKDYHAVLKKINYDDNLHFYLTTIRCLYQLTGVPLPADLFSTAFHSEEDHLRYLKELRKKNQHVPLTAFYIYQARFFYLNGEFAKALEMSSEADRLIGLSSHLVHSAEHYFYYTLILASLHKKNNFIQKQVTLFRMKKCISVLRKMANHSPENFVPLYHLALAELDRIRGRTSSAESLYRQAGEEAATNNALHLMALTSELEGAFLIDENKITEAVEKIKDAIYFYQEWGAASKIKRMKTKYQMLLETNENTFRASSSTYGVISPESYDMMSVIRSSHAISEEISSSNLLNTIMKVMIENAGAVRGILLLIKNGEMRAEAEININSRDAIMMKETAVTPDILPLSVINYVQHSGESILLNNAQLELPFSRDHYIRNNKSHSILALPIHKGKATTGILYLENNLMKGAFTPARVEVLKLLATQASISIENARLYESTMKLNKDLEKSNHELQNEIAERTKSENMLRKSEQLLIERNRDLDTFIYKASHDLKGPLSSVIGLTNVARLDIREPKALEYFELISKNTQRLDNILHDLIDLTRVTKGSLQYQPVLFNELISKILDTLQHLPGYGDMKFRVFVDNSTPFHSDSKMLTSVFQNLIENAVKYRRMDDMGSFLDIRIKKHSDGVIIELEDNGLGIPDEVQKKVFDMFFRAHKHSKGSGLGLYIVKTAIEKLGGTISLSSIENKGSTFVLFLPHRTSNPVLEQ